MDNDYKNGKRVLIVDDDETSREAVSRVLTKVNYQVVGAESVEEAKRIIENTSVDLVITDLVMPRGDGMDVLKFAKEKDPSIGVIILTGYGTIENTVKAMKQGADNYLTKPINFEELRLVVRGIVEKQNLIAENLALKRRLDEKYSFHNLVGGTPQMQSIFDKIAQIAPSNANILIQGESGTGKGLIANAIHQNSFRKNGPFISLNCAALSEGVIESELFGHEKGAFTGAINQRRGKFELANGGTLFLDEVAEIPPSTQVKLLNVLEERTFSRVGGEKPISVDFRLIAATNKNLEKAVEAKEFREDLYYRLKVVTTSVPPLRERKEDIPMLISTFINQANQDNHKALKGISKEALEVLMRYHWPGNVRELKNTIESMVVLSTKDILEAFDIPPNIRHSAPDKAGLDIRVGMSLKDIERETIRRTLSEVGGARDKAAKMLDISVRTLYRKINEYGLS